MPKLYLITEDCEDPYYGLRFPTEVHADMESAIKSVRNLMQYTDPYIFEASENGFKDITKDVMCDIESEDTEYEDDDVECEDTE